MMAHRQILFVPDNFFAKFSTVIFAAIHRMLRKRWQSAGSCGSGRPQDPVELRRSWARPPVEKPLTKKVRFRRSCCKRFSLYHSANKSGFFLTIMFYSYVLKSLRDQGYYFGHCSNLDLRLQKHNAGKNAKHKSKTTFDCSLFRNFSNKIGSL